MNKAAAPPHAGGRRCSALLTDLYQLTMANGYWKSGTHDREAVFHLCFRSQPFQGGFSIACGLSDAIDYLKTLTFLDEELAYLGTLTGNDGKPLLDPAFLDYLRTLEWRWDVDGIPEGTVVFPQEPLLRIQGPLLQCQIVETALLNLINFQTLIATKAARVCLAAEGEPVLEFGLRRAQGVDGALAASRAAYIGGCAATSNVLAGQLFGIPVRGTHAHSWVMSFDSEEEAFRTYAEAMPNNAVFLVDTYDTLRGVERAIKMGRWLREQGHELAGVRLDSGDLAWLSIETRRILDAAGFPQAAIVASNDLDEHTITSLKQQGARINVWGVGTKLVTAYDQPALGGVYKLAAVRNADGAWEHKVKLSEQAAKISSPGLQQVRRFRHEGHFVGDMIFDLDGPPEQSRTIVDPADLTRRKRVAEEAEHEDLLVPIFRAGALLYQRPPIAQTRDRAQAQLGGFHEGHKRFLNPHEYPVGLSPSLHALRTSLILKARGEDVPVALGAQAVNLRKVAPRR
ncbi:MAG: nicotinate phosphoribosyltransferase [Chthoniobacter sp.]|jgi:nicotinate phosphoribosyltransferase|nr:nicotinate phosphoribosyltransferase [Chthoniobacter sp.]